MTMDLLALDKEVASTVLALRTLPDDDDPASPIPRRVSTLELAARLGELVADPLAARLRAWVATLAIERVTFVDRWAAERARRSRVPDQAGDRGLPVATLARMLLTPGRDHAIAAGELDQRDDRELDPLLRWLERRSEAERRAAAHLAELQVAPVSDALVERVLDGLRGILPASTFADGIDLGLARDAGEGWPTFLTPRSVRDLLGAPLFEGRNLPNLALPAPLGASSFARAFARVAGELTFVDRDRATPFALARAPHDPLLFRRSALFATLVLEPAFHRRRLGLSPPAARQQVRTLGRAFAAWVRDAAFRCHLPALARSNNRVADFAELTERVFGRPSRSGWFGRVPRLDVEARHRLAGLLGSTRDRRTLRERFDEDWFDNPRALEELRHENCLSLVARAERPPEEGDARLLVLAVVEALDA
jgi:hypothetical protein